MKIAVWHNLPSGGGKRLLHGHIRELAARGHQVEAWCPNTADSEYLPLSGLIKETVLPMANARIAWWKRRGNPIVEMNARVEAMMAHCRETAVRIDSSGAEILLATSCRAFYMPHIGQFTKLPKVVYLHEPFRPLYEAMPSLVWKAPPRLAGLSQFINEARFRLNEHCRTYAARIQAREEFETATRYDLILTNSLFNRESIMRAYGLESEVCYPGVDVALPTGTTLPKQDFIAGMGSITFNKGIERSLRALATIPSDRRPELRWIANHSDPQNEETVRVLAAQLDVELTLLKSITDMQIRDVLSAAAVFIYTPRLEPFGLAPLEANACGTPVVALAEGGVRETIQDGVNGLLVHSAWPEKLGSAIDRLLGDSALRQRMSQSSMQHVADHWSIERSALNLESHLRKVLQQNEPTNA